MRKFFVPEEINRELLRRLSLGSEEEQTLHGHAIMGTPWEVPVPKN